MTEKFLPPEQVKANAKAALAQLRADKESPYYKAYFDKSFDPVLHDLAVTTIAQLAHLAETGTVEFEDGTVNPAFMDKGEMQEIVGEYQAQKLAKRGIQMPESPTAEGSREATGGDDGEAKADTVASLHADPEFMKAYTQGRYDNPEGHAAAVERMASAFRAESAGGSDGEE